MHVGINAHLLAFTSDYRQAGLSRYIYEIVTRLPRCATRSGFTAFTGNAPVPREFVASKPPNLKISRSRFTTAKAPVRIAWEQAVLPFAASRANLDLLHCPVNVRPLFSKCPVVITVHDLIFLRYPEAFHPAKRAYLKYMTGWSARHAAHVIAVSEQTRNDVIELLRVKPDRVTTVHNGVGSQFVPVPGEQRLEFAREKGLTPRTVLYVGTLEPRKNITMLIEAFGKLASNPEYDDTTLMIGGSKGWYYEEVFTTAERLGLTASGRVRFLGRVPDEELPLWYNVASVFVFPSMYEGFGLPPLEAMACGTPVITSNTSSLPEVVGDAGIVLPHDEPVQWAGAMQAVLDNPAISAELGAKGLQRSKQFNWDRAAKETLAVYRLVLEEEKQRGGHRRPRLSRLLRK